MSSINDHYEPLLETNQNTEQESEMLLDDRAYKMKNKNLKINSIPNTRG